MKRQASLSLALLALFALAVGGLLLWDNDEIAQIEVAADEVPSIVVRPDSQVVGVPGSSGVTFVEFLDFECEACGAAFPIVEELREEYAGRVTFVARYFPLDSHFNSRRAAAAVASAARQGKFVEMYQKMYEAQPEWAEQRKALDEVFRRYAEDLGLDMAVYDKDYASQEVADRVQADVDDGVALGVQGTPTFLIDGEKFEPESVQDFSSALDSALAARS